jgi:hypothetical protein
MALISHSHFDHLHGDSFFPAAKFYVGKEELATYDDEASYHNFHGYDLWSVMMPGIKRPGYGSVIPMPEDVPVSPGFRKIPVAGAFKDQDQIILGKYTSGRFIFPAILQAITAFIWKNRGCFFPGISIWQKPARGTATSVLMLVIFLPQWKESS